MWEYEPGLDQMGTPDALMLLPYWTHSCIGSMEGLYYESSATTPYHFINAAELSLQPSDPVRGLNYPATPNVADGVRHLQLLGVKYYMALTPETQTQADADPDLTLVATSGPWPENYSGGTERGSRTGPGRSTRSPTRSGHPPDQPARRHEGRGPRRQGLAGCRRVVVPGPEPLRRHLRRVGARLLGPGGAQEATRPAPRWRRSRSTISSATTTRCRSTWTPSGCRSW